MTLLRMMAFTPFSTQTTVQAEKTPPSASASLHWPTLVKQLPITGFLKSLALHCSLETYKSNAIYLALDPKQKVLYTQERESLLQDALSRYLKKRIVLHIRIGSTSQLTPASLEEKEQHEQRQTVYQAVLSNPNIKSIKEKFDATIQPEAIHINSKKPYE